jgi:hypothetical protein
MMVDKTGERQFLQEVVELAPPGSLAGAQSFLFEIGREERPHESYSGLNVRCRYVLAAVVARGLAGDLVREREVIVQRPVPAPAACPPIRMEVGIEECLHIEFEFDREALHLSDVVTGSVNFMLVRIRVKHMELALVRRETAGSGSSVFNESETVTKFELMDGAPVRGERIPVRMYLSGLDVTPTYRAVEGIFSVRYFLNLVLIDEEDRRYFKQSEIKLWRRVVK